MASVELFLITSIKKLALAGFFCYDKSVFRAGCDSRPAVNLTSYFSFLVVVLSRYTLSIIFDCEIGRAHV